jgi:SAM-dependent methyltransferase
MHALSATLTTTGFAPMPGTFLRKLERALSIELRCPECHENLGSASYRSLANSRSEYFCTACSAKLTQENGIWGALPAARRAHFAKFVKDYEQVRKEEGRGSDNAEYYLALPFSDLTGRNAGQWSIRGKTFRYIERGILPGLTGSPPLTILDLGAGNCWMSHRLAHLGHRPVAVDLLTNSQDGLGAASHYRGALPELFPRFQAELDHLPFADAQFDCAIFNASFHYSENYDRTLEDAIRCLRPGGTVVIADSPTYGRELFGEQMRRERQDDFLKRFGFRSDALNSGEYLTPERMIALEARHDLEWKTDEIWYGMRWACRPWIAKWRKRRPPSQFFLYSAQVKGQ